MHRLTVLYSLPPGADETAYIEWRLSAHADYLKTMPGVICATFGRVQDQWSSRESVEYTFQTTVEWPTKAAFEQAFYSDQAQADLKENLKKLGDYTFIVTEVIAGG